MPFSHEQFLDVFAAYNQKLWPFAILLWLLTFGALFHLWRMGPRASRFVATVLVIHWAWSAVAYHLAFFWRINPAAVLFAALFMVQAALLFWQGVVLARIRFAWSWSTREVLGLALILYSLAYPALGFLFGLSYPRLPTFGVPCPTTILTAGLLVLVPRQEARVLAVIPLIWTVVGGSGAFLLGVRADIALVVAGLLLLFHVLRLPARVTASLPTH